MSLTLPPSCGFVLGYCNLGSKPTCAILLCPWERHFTAVSPAWWSWQAVLNYSHTSIKLQADSNILASPEAGRVIAYPMYVPSIAFLRVRRINTV